MTRNYLYKSEVSINSKIHVVIPTLRDIIQDEDKYYGVLSMFTAMPIDMMVQLDDAGIDFSAINEYELFLLLFNGLKDIDTSLILRDINFKDFELATNEKNDEIVLLNRKADIVIDRGIHDQIASTLRVINRLEKNNRKPGNEEARRYLIERARKKQKRAMRQASESSLESLIIAMVNTEQFKYNYETVLDLSVYQFNESVRQIIKKVDYDNRMFGVYSGTISAKDLSQDDLNWLIHK